MVFFMCNFHITVIFFLFVQVEEFYDQFPLTWISYVAVLHACVVFVGSKKLIGQDLEVVCDSDNDRDHCTKPFVVLVV